VYVFQLLFECVRYSRAWGFFDTLLPTLGVRDPSTGTVTGQHGGTVALENAYWRLILLDTGYGTYAWLPKPESRNNTQPDAVVDWLVNEVRIGDPTDKRGIIFFTHHQVESAFEEPHDATPKQIAKLMPPGRTVLWSAPITHDALTTRKRGSKHNKSQRTKLAHFLCFLFSLVRFFLCFNFFFNCLIDGG
jgi:hypothetical protein